MNIGLGGSKSNNTTIMENRIKGSKGEGIFMTECCGASILRNDILENNDGIVALSSTAIVNKNFISKNQGNGILLLKQTNL
jgi:parallel beta-helix repeat protein